MARTSRWSGVGLLLIGLVAVAIAIVFGYREYDDLRDAIAVDGMVVKLNAGGAHPEVDFTTTSGEHISTAQSGLIWGYQPGDHVRVLYLPSNPQQTATLDTVGARYPGVCLTAPVALAFLLVGIVKLVLAQRLARMSLADEVRTIIRWQEQDLVARLRPRWSRIVTWFVIGAINVVLSAGTGPMMIFTLVGGTALIGWSLYLAILRSTRISLDGGRMLVESGRFGSRLEVPIDEIDHFESVKAATGSHTAVVVRRNGGRETIPLHISGVEIATRPGNRHLFPVPREHTEFIVERLSRILKSAIHHHQ